MKLLSLNWSNLWLAESVIRNAKSTVILKTFMLKPNHQVMITAKEGKAHNSYIITDCVDTLWNPILLWITNYIITWYDIVLLTTNYTWSSTEYWIA